MGRRNNLRKKEKNIKNRLMFRKGSFSEKETLCIKYFWRTVIFPIILNDILQARSLSEELEHWSSFSHTNGEEGEEEEEEKKYRRVGEERERIKWVYLSVAPLLRLSDDLIVTLKREERVSAHRQGHSVLDTYCTGGNTISIIRHINITHVS